MKKKKKLKIKINKNKQNELIENNKKKNLSIQKEY